MQNYQLWLQRKCYSQHLNNLIKIRLHTSQRKTVEKNRPVNSVQQQRKINSVHKCATTNNSTEPNFSYILTRQQLQKHKIRLVKSSQIINENRHMAKRIRDIKPHIDSKLSLQIGRKIKAKRDKQRKGQFTNSIRKLKDYQMFQQFQNQKIQTYHQLIFKIKIQKCIRMLNSHPQNLICLEIFNLRNKRIAKTSCVSSKNFFQHEFQIPLQNELQDNFSIKINLYKRLQLKIIGQYMVSKPQKDKNILEDLYSVNNRENYIQANIFYSKVNRKCWNSNLFIP